MKNLNYLMYHIPYQIFKIILNISSKTRRKTAKHLKNYININYINYINYITIYIDKLNKRITFKIKAGYYLERLTPETMKLLGSAQSKITKDEHGENLPYLKVTEVVLIHCNFVNKSYQQTARVLYTIARFLNCVVNF